MRDSDRPDERVEDRLPGHAGRGESPKEGRGVIRAEETSRGEARAKQMLYHVRRAAGRRRQSRQDRERLERRVTRQSEPTPAHGARDGPVVLVVDDDERDRDAGIDERFRPTRPPRATRARHR